MFAVIPIRTESDIRRTPLVNYALIAANVFFFTLFSEGLAPEPVLEFQRQYLVFRPSHPAIHQFFAYQFLHADIMHLLGNMLFLWVFGNSVNAKMGDIPYLLFYLAGGVFAAWVFASLSSSPAPLIGASGAIASVTTAYLALFPRSRVTVLVWLVIFIHFFELPALILIGIKIIVWDNMIAPNIRGGAGNIAYSAHLAGYLFGFVGALGMLLVRALPRDHFDIIALWKRWNQRREFSSAMAAPGAKDRARFGGVARTETSDPAERAAEQKRFEQITGLRTAISEQLAGSDRAGAVVTYEELLAVESKQCLAEHDQLEIAREYYGSGRFAEAAAAFERYVECFRTSGEATNVRLLLGIMYARDLGRFEDADAHLSDTIRYVRDPARREQCLEWLRSVRQRLGRAAPEG